MLTYGWKYCPICNGETHHTITDSLVICNGCHTEEGALKIMDEKQVFERAMESLDKLAEVSADMKAHSAERLEAVAKITATLPWKDVATLSIGWEIHAIDDSESIFPTLNVVMKG